MKKIKWSEVMGWWSGSGGDLDGSSGQTSHRNWGQKDKEEKMQTFGQKSFQTFSPEAMYLDFHKFPNIFMSLSYTFSFKTMCYKEIRNFITWLEFLPTWEFQSNIVVLRFQA